MHRAPVRARMATLGPGASAVNRSRRNASPADDEGQGVDLAFDAELVERKGIEPSTFALRTRRSPS